MFRRGALLRLRRTDPEYRMAKNEQKVMEFVEKELKANPKQTTTELFEKAKKVDTGVAKLSLRQFNARFPLQIKRKQSQAATGGRRRPAAKSRKGAPRGREGRRLAMRDVFLQFATDLSSAEERKDLVAVLARVDQYVAEAMKAAGR
jgi:hypothetical protein